MRAEETLEQLLILDQLNPLQKDTECLNDTFVLIGQNNENTNDANDADGNHAQLDLDPMTSLQLLLLLLLFAHTHTPFTIAEVVDVTRVCGQTIYRVPLNPQLIFGLSYVCMCAFMHTVS